MKRDRMVGSILVMVSLVLWFFIIPFQVEGPKEAKYPRFVVIWIGITSLSLILRSLKKTPARLSDEAQEKIDLPVFMGIVILLLMCVLSIDLLGFFIPCFLFLVISMLMQGVRDWKVYVLVPSTLLLFIYLLIERLLTFPLPKGKVFW